MIKFNAYDSAIYRLSPILWKLMPWFIPSEITEGGTNHIIKSKQKILDRFEKVDLPRRDFCSILFEMRDEFRFSDWNLAAYSNALIVAGSETTATLLTGLTYRLCRTPEVYAKLREEVRARFTSSQQITSQTATFPYLTAVINETMRIYPPIPIAMPRITPDGGETVAGVFVPGGVRRDSPFC